MPVDAAHPLASWFLWSAPTLFLLVYGLPLLVAPLWWARLFRWRVGGDDDLTVYLGRCLGAVAIAVIACAYRAAPAPAANPILFELIAVIGILLAGVHAWGALRRRQPWTETVEIALYVLVAILAVSLRRTL